MLWRGFTRRCPVCGSGSLFRGWFTLVEQCPRCDLRFERIDGHASGALGINTVVSIIVLFAVGIVGFVVTFPELPLVPLVSTAVGVALLFPIFFYPFSKTIWTAVDVRMRPLEPGEADSAYTGWLAR